MRLTQLIFLAIFSLFSITAESQTAPSIKGKKMVWYGLDFSQAKMIGSEGFESVTAELIKDKFFNSWNKLIVREADKYDLQGAFKKESVMKDLSIIEARNEAVLTENLITDDESHSLSEDDISQILSEYPKGEFTEGLGCVFIVESFNKLTDKGSIWVTLFDISTGKVVKTKRMQGKSGGFGVRNYWARSIYNVINILKKEFKKW